MGRKVENRQVEDFCRGVCEVSTSRAEIGRRQSGTPLTVSHTILRFFEVLLVNEFLQNAVEHHCFLSQDHVTPSDRGSQEEEVGRSQGPSRKTTECTVSRIKEPEQSFSTVWEEMKQVFATLNEYKVAI